ncbi:AfsA-related hotdog domain-containing protein [Microbacterium oxydans]|uniref:A-factor biosynthesis hotdog domain protein n=1 Tax=Microbacterium oxydans TaxID=82380 RepID=A0A0F0L7Z4_9MICO|nr:AfsA-related hotdog domain-containing protein [Microbacterium oxydans]KJL29253.1 A-factor biosynthesis hotdog domain protein [Microbacterium oxydans]
MNSKRLPPLDVDGAAASALTSDVQLRPEDVHKAKSENVWIQAPSEESPHSLSARFEVPAEGEALRLVDLIEIQRQAGIFQAHRQFGVPHNEVFVLDQMSLKRVTATHEWADSHRKGRVRSQIVATGLRGRARSLVQHFALETSDGLIVVGRAKSSLIPAAVYQRVRKQPTQSNISAPGSKRSGFTYEELLQVDEQDPLLSDHPSDHLTAVQAIADVERVAQIAAPGSNLRALKLTFQRYAEANPTPTLRLKVSGSGRLAAEIVQHGVRRAKLAGALVMRRPVDAR